MRIKRFTAPDMRTALRMVRDEQGPDAVILSTRPSADGACIEVVAATDYDEALVAQALRAAAPAIADAPARPQAATAAPARAASASASPAGGDASTRDSLISRARAVFRIGDAPTLADLTRGAPDATPAAAPAAAAPAAARPSAAPAPAPAAPAVTPAASATPAPSMAARPPIPGAVSSLTAASPTTPAPAAIAPPAPSRFEAMMAALDAAPTQAPRAGTSASAAAAAEFEPATPAFLAPRAPVADAAPAERPGRDDDAEDFGDLMPDFPMPLRPEPVTEAAARATHDAVAAHAPDAARPMVATATATADTTAPRALQAVAAPELDPAIVSMREEMARMRQLMEAQMEQLSLERLRGSPARAAVLEALAGYGCDESLAREVAAQIDPRLPVDAIHGPMFETLARMITVTRSEPLEDGGVIALVGPTGAGKTTTAAKLAARFAARHRARDVALVTTDCERPGALEQLQAHGRRLGITVCEAQGPERLQDTLAQLVDYPLVLVDTTGHAPRDRAVFSQILWLRASRRVRSLLVLPANAHPYDLGEVVRRYRPAKPEGVVLTKLDETGRLGSALSVLARHELAIAYTTQGQQVPSDLDAADATRLVQSLEKSRRAADNPLATEDRHAVA
ncbi:flagellar biosynthesis protein FlhF [Luteimonas kalidii]|uniref:Flagellar biosynthesis protein FlhF n=1 Tax=Luteimonas kalidii TaxID=3042025 RepID=A0ABT6JW63_9GAMM|nr:flagellar biosynthesis protein FlhF [Luteimonas kalidii]MDH5834933.1 flagellar biosynthesis protein FlhF [Luteimonas kalidii]